MSVLHAIKLVLAVALLALSPLAAGAQQGQDDWITLGEQPIASGREVVEVGRQEGAFARLRLEAVRGEAFVDALRVTYIGGEIDELPVRQLVSASRGSNPIRIGGGRVRAIAQVEIVTRADPGARSGAVLRLLGEQAEDADPPGGRAARSGGGAGGFEELDAQRIELRNERFVLSMGRGEGRTSAIRVRVDGAPLYIRRLEIVYGRDRTQDVRIAETIEPGAETRVIDLEGDLRTAREIVVVTRPDTSRGTARIALEGLPGPDPGPVTAQPPRSPPAPAPDMRADPRSVPRDWQGSIDPAMRGRIEPPPATDPSGVPSGLVLLGSQRAAFRAGRDIVRVGPQAGLLDKIVLRVLDNDVFLIELTIVYADGERERLAVRKEIRANSLTPAIRLRGDRAIREIELIHQSRPDRRGEATVEIYGEHAEPVALRPPGPAASLPPPPPGGWVLLGRQRAQMFNDDIDTYPVGSQHGPLRALRLTAKRHAVMIFGLRVVYADGGVERIRTDFDLRDGETSPPIDLGGPPRPIERVVILHRSRINFKGEGDTELWGLR
jgi:hypothetical protein